MKKRLSFPYGLYAYLLGSCFFEMYHVESIGELLAHPFIGISTEQELRAALKELHDADLIDYQRCYNAPQWLAIRLMRAGENEEEIA